MTALSIDYIQDILPLFKSAPDYFYSPCGRTTDITKNEIDIRSYLVPRQLRISTNEIVFRKLWEITKHDKSTQKKSIIKALSFFKTLNYTDDTLYLITETLKKELLYLINSKGRVMHNPY